MAKLPSGVRKRKDGKLEKRFTIKGVRYSVYGATVKEITQKELDTRERIKNGEYTQNANITLDSYFLEWIERKKIDTKENSLKTYKTIYNTHLSSVLGKTKIVDIERRQVIEIQKDLSSRYTPTTCNYIISVLKIILNDAVKDEIISKNPCNNIKNIKIEKKANESYHRALTEEEQKIFMQECKSSYYYEFFALAISSGMRFGELTALTWDDIDFSNNVIHVNKTSTFGLDNKITVGTTKSDAGTRDIPITPNIKKILMSQRDKIGHIYNIDKSKDNVFISMYGRDKDIYNSTINHEIAHILERLKKQGFEIEHFTVHAFRDTFATRFIEQGGTMQTLKTILGHSSITMTMDIYAHVLPNTKQDEMNKIQICI